MKKKLKCVPDSVSLRAGGQVDVRVYVKDDEDVSTPVDLKALGYDSAVVDVVETRAEDGRRGESRYFDVRIQGAGAPPGSETTVTFDAPGYKPTGVHVTCPSVVKSGGVPKGIPDHVYQYVAPILCVSLPGGGSEATSGAVVQTRVGILNPFPQRAYFSKRISLTAPGQAPYAVSEWINDELDWHESLTVGCEEIANEFELPGERGTAKYTFERHEGFLVVMCSQRLDVAATYLTTGPEGDISVHVEQIKERDVGLAAEGGDLPERR